MKGIAYLVACGAPPAGAIAELVQLLQGEAWDVLVVPTPSGMAWLDIPRLEEPVAFPRRT